MSLLSESFEGSLMPAGWANIDAGDAAASTTGHSGNAARLTNPMSYGGYIYSSFAATSSIIVDLWFRASQFMYFGSSPISPIIQLLNGTTPLLSVVPGSGGDIHIYKYSGSSGTEVVAGSAFLSSSTWYNLRLEAVLTASGSATFKIDGVTDITSVASAGDYANGTAGATKIMLGTCPFTDVDYDELDVSASTGSGSVMTFIRRNPGGFKKLGL